MAAQYKNRHAPFASGNCGACHNAHYGDRFQLLIDEPDRLCVSCHRGGLNAAHKGFPVKVQSGCLTCHNPHGSDRSALVRNVLHEPYQNDCSECHESEPTTGSHDVHIADGANCVDCHNAGADPTTETPPSTEHRDDLIDTIAGVGYTDEKAKNTAFTNCTTASCHDDGTGTVVATSVFCG